MSEKHVSEGKNVVEEQATTASRTEGVETTVPTADRSTSPEHAATSAARGNPHLAIAIEDAHLLLAFAARNGKELDVNLTREILRVGAKSTLSVEEEVAFWSRFRELAAQIAPISPESIRAMTLEVDSNLHWWEFWNFWKWWRWGRDTYARRAVRYHRGLAFCTLIVLVAVQAFAAFGVLIISDIAARKEQLKDVEVRLLTAGEASEQKASDAAEDADGTREPGNAREKRARQRPSGDKLLKTEQENLYTYLEADYRWLKHWNHLPELLLGFDGMYAADDEDDPNAAIQDNVARLQSATVILDLIQKYILPLVYGLLGACVYILRDLSAKLKNCSFTKTSRINFHIRQYLGMLGGLAVGWFVTPEPSSGPFVGLSPLALAFLAGYSIELLFRAMDALIGAFGGKKQAGAPGTGE